ncbi:MAG: hydantoinase/oxoprolinase family protein, partial [Chloroflexi bacterium]
MVLGIDTGGTYTDGVLLDYASRDVLTSFKSLTTRRDFAVGIEAVIDGIQIDDPTAIKMVSISTTLATNAIAEGKGRRVGLLLIGYDSELVAKFKMAQRFGTPHYAYIAGGHDLYGREKEPLDLPAILQQVDAFKQQVDAIAVSSYFSPLNPEHENEAHAAIRKRCDLPVVLGHQLSTKLGSVERATTAALNASLLAVLQELMLAVRQAMAQRDIDAPLMVVRGDGTLMSAEFAADTPVETIHSGPAASAIGGRFLSGLDDALVIDVGGTTTDIALVESGQVAVSGEGAMVNGYKTAVSAANILSIALGGDSHIHLKAGKKLGVGPERVVPLAYLADQYPQVNQQLKSLSNRMRARATADWLEYWFLAAAAPDETANTTHEKAIIRLLRDGPQPVPTILKKLNLLHVGQLDVDNLWRLEVLGKSGLTPTDLLHVEGHFTPWQVEAAQHAVNLFYRFLYREPAELHQQVWQTMTDMVMRAVITFLSGKTVPDPTNRQEADDLGYWLFNNSLYDWHPHL